MSVLPAAAAPPLLSVSTADVPADLLRAIVEYTASANSLWQPVVDEQGDLVDFRYVFINPAAANYLSRDNEDLVGELVSSIVGQFKESGQFAIFANVYTSNIPFRQEMMHPVLHRWLDISASRVGNHLLMSFYDVHDIHMAAERMQAQTELLQKVVNHAPSGMMLLEAIRNESGKIVDFKYLITNELNARLSGFTVDQMTGQAISSFFPGYQDSLELFGILVQVASTGETVQNTFDYDNYGIKGTFEGYYLKQGDGVLFTFMNVTRLAEQQKQLENMNRELARSNESLQQFAYVASHDLQEPLRKVQSFGKMLADQFNEQLGPTGTDLVNRMRSSAQRMSALIHDLLNYARLSTEKEPLRPVKLDLIMQDALADLDLHIQETRPTIQIDPLPVVVGSAVQLRQVFQNLLSNALKFQAVGNSPMVAVRCQPANPAHIPADLPADKAYWQIDVQDNGIGFSQQYADRIFEVFQRLHGKNKYSGTGVGLAICRRVAETHGGGISVTSEPGVGSTFSFFLPK
jgi:signal transduction histidine kinase